MATQNTKPAPKTEIIRFSIIKPTVGSIRSIFNALSFERHGFWAKETVGFIKKLASSRAVALGLEPSEEIRRWYAVISCCIQRSNAKVLRGEPVPGRPTPPPSRFAAMGRDLGFAA